MFKICLIRNKHISLARSKKLIYNVNMYPMLLIPHTEHPIWSGERLQSEYKINSAKKIGEAYNMSTLPKRESIIANGEFSGKTLTDVISSNPDFVKVGSANHSGELPLLFKLIDTLDKLSVQVHPDDSYSKRAENQLGKTESWYILYSKDGSFIYLGLNDNYTRAEVDVAIKNNTVENLLNKIYVKAGDYYYIPSGTVHALGANITIAEIQQSSMVTYRMYDFDRRDNQGNPRELHIEKSLDVLDYTKADLSALYHSSETLDKNKFFTVNCEKYFEVLIAQINQKTPYGYEDFSLLTFTEGHGRVTANGITTKANKGQSIFLPKGLSAVIEGDCTVLVNRIPLC